MSACGSSTLSFEARDEAAVRGLFDSTVTDVRAANWDSWAARYAEDAFLHLPGGPALVGRAAIKAWAASIPESPEEYSFSDVQVSVEGPLAYGASAIHLTMGGMAYTQKQLVVFKRDTNGHWWIQAVSVTSNEPNF